MATVDSYIAENEGKFLEGLKEFLRIPSIGALPEHAADMVRCAEYAARKMADLGLTNVQVLPTGGPPVVFGEWLGAPGAPTVLLYGHYDVQPVDPVELWHSPPFEPQLVDGPHGKRFVARGAVDDKGQTMMFLEALRAWHTAGGGIPARLTVLIEGEEEIGSEHLDRFVAEHRDLLKADLCVISDSGWLDRGVPSITYGLRRAHPGRVQVHLDARRARIDLEFRLRPRRQPVLHEALERRVHLGGILVRHQAERHFRAGLRSDHRLAAGAGIAAPDAVDIGGRPRP